MKLSLLPYLCCLSCRSPLTIRIDESKKITNNTELEIFSGSLLCQRCSGEYVITKGVPRLTRNDLSNPQDVHTGERFAQAWKEFPRSDARYHKQFYDWVHPVDPEFIRGKVILEAGCGKGRHSKIVAEDGAKVVIGIDIGDAIDVAYQQVGYLSNVHLLQCDIRNLPFDQVFDFAFSVGVLHHMTHPEDGFASLIKSLKPGGSVCTWVYGRENNDWLVYLVNPIRRALTSKLPPAPLKLCARIMAVPVYLSAKLFFQPYVWLKSKLKWLPKIFYEKYLSYIAAFDFVEIHHIVFDHLTAPIAYYVPGAHVRQWFERAGLHNIVIRWHNENSWMGFASRPGPLEVRHESELETLSV